jgi:hypothetical protein
MEFVMVLKEVATQLESRHTENGEQENSRWNRCHGIKDDELSMQARNKFNQAFAILKEINEHKTITAAEILTSLARLHK